MRVAFCNMRDRNTLFALCLEQIRESNDMMGLQTTESNIWDYVDHILSNPQNIEFVLFNEHDAVLGNMHIELQDGTFRSKEIRIQDIYIRKPYRHQGVALKAIEKIIRMYPDSDITIDIALLDDYPKFRCKIQKIMEKYGFILSDQTDISNYYHWEKSK